MNKIEELKFVEKAFSDAKVTLENEFHMGEYVRKPEQKGCCPGGELSKELTGWYLYETDEHCRTVGWGPFEKEALVYAIALKNGVSKQMEAWKFSGADRDTYIHGVKHFR